MRILYPLLLLFIQTGFLFSQNTVTGIVFDDSNSNGIYDEGEKGIPNVAVSNGIDVVMTNDEGTYQLPISDDVIVFVIKPADYKYPVNKLNLPNFYYIHKPKGSPRLKYEGVKPTGKLPEQVNFPLIKHKYEKEFSIVVISDPQLFTKKDAEYYRKDIIEDIPGPQKHSFGVTAGDIVHDDLDLFKVINAETAKVGIPWFHVMGNHDMNFDAKTFYEADETYELHYGPSSYAFNHGDVHFIMLRDVIFPNDKTESFYIGGFHDDQLKFIKNNLKYVPKDKLIVIMVHIPIVNEEPWRESFLSDSRNKLFELLKDYPHTFSLSGHTHIQRHYFIGKEQGWMRDKPHHHYNIGTASGDWWSGAPKSTGTPDATMRDGTPNGYNIITFKGNKYFYEYKVSAKPDNYKMRLYGPKKVRANIYNGGDLYVNFFQGTPLDTVIYSVNGGEWKPMRYVVESDPHNQAQRYIWDNSDELPQGNRPSAPELCYHLWRARVPTNLPLGRNRIFIKITDIFGRVYEDTFNFEIVK